MWFEQMHPSWQLALEPQRQLLNELEARLAGLANLAPEASRVMAAFEVDPASVRVVIIGQDPYPTPGVAVGRSFAISGGPTPASLRNMLKELAADIPEFSAGPNLDLHGWQSQGVLLLNRVLTTEQLNPGAHQKRGWEAFTDAALAHLITQNPQLILVLWGAQAQQLKTSLGPQLALAGNRVTIIESAHPSPLSARRGFFGSKPFSAVNAALTAAGESAINWYL